MKIALIAPSPVPFVFGGAERLFLDLVRALNELTPHEVELIKLPFPERDLFEVIDGYRRFLALDMSAFDAVISTKYPAWMVEHPHHIVYLQHKLRGLYDAYPRHLPTALPKAHALQALAKLLALPHPGRAEAMELFAALEDLKTAGDPAWFAYPGPLARQVVHFLDRVGLAPCKIARYAAISRTVAERPGYFHAGVEVHIAYHPSGLKVEALPFPAPPVLFTASRLDAPKRIDLIVRAFGQVGRADARLRIAGTGPHEQALRELAAGDERIEFLGRLSDAELAKAYAQAQAVVFVPQAEDLGLIALEAGLAARPVITCTDSGGVTELVRHGETGWVAEPNPNALAQAMERMLASPQLAQRLGENARRFACTITWDQVIAALGLDASKPTYVRPARLRPIVVLAPFSLRPPRFGGANRIFHLYRAWARFRPVHVVCLGARNARFQFDALTVEEVATSEPFERHAAKWSQALGVSARDLALLDGMAYLPQYTARVRELVAQAQLVVLSHPYCLYALPTADLPPWVYDAHNVEQDLKAAMWQRTCRQPDTAAQALALVCEAEAEALRRASAVLAVCAEEAERLRALYAFAGRVVLAPNGVDLSARRFAQAADRQRLRVRLAQERPLAVFVGSGHEPNVAALETVLALAARLPEVAFALAGSVCTHPRLKTAPANLARLGPLNEAELTVLLQAAEVGLNPVTFGAGTNLKVLDYAACGAAILSTPFGMRGLPFTHGVEAWLAEADAFGPALEALLADAKLRERLRCAARARAEGFSWDKLGARALEELVQAGIL